MSLGRRERLKISLKEAGRIANEIWGGVYLVRRTTGGFEVLLHSATGPRHLLDDFGIEVSRPSFPNPRHRGRLNVKHNRPRRTKRRTGLIKDMRFFREHGAMVVGEGSRIGLDLARAEREMKKRGWDHAFVPEYESYEDVYGEKPPEGAEFATVVLLDTEFNDRWTERELWSHVIGSLGFVDTRDRKYVRVVVAELALEALAQSRRRK